jgi:hypothetical protein
MGGEGRGEIREGRAGGGREGGMLHAGMFFGISRLSRIMVLDVCVGDSSNAMGAAAAERATEDHSKKRIMVHEVDTNLCRGYMVP